MTPIPFIGPSYKGRSDNYSAQRCVNWYLEGGKGKAPAQLIGCPGLTAPWVTLAGSGMRGMYLIDSTRSVMVCGGNVYLVTSLAASSLLGNVSDDGRPVTIVEHSGNIMIASAGTAYALTTTGTSSSVVAADIGMVDFLNDHFVATKNNSGLYIWSEVNTPTFDPGNDQDTNGSPDILVGVRVARRTMFFFGGRSIEQWYDAGGLDNPFSRIDGAFFEVGCVAKDSIAELDQVFWLGGDDKGAGAVWTMSGGAPKRISTPAIEYAIAQWPDMTDAEAFTYSQEGHGFYVLSSNSGDETWAYDVATEEWHQRAYLGPDGSLKRILPRCHLYFAGKHLVGDWRNGNVYELSLDTYSDNGNPLPAIRACEIIQAGLENMRNGSFQLDMDTGVGLTVGQGSDPQAMLRWSKDGGKTWSNSLWRSFGKIGEYFRRAIWRRVGGGRRVVFEVTITDPVKRNIVGAYIG